MELSVVQPSIRRVLLYSQSCKLIILGWLVLPPSYYIIINSIQRCFISISLLNNFKFI